MAGTLPLCYNGCIGLFELDILYSNSNTAASSHFKYWSEIFFPQIGHIKEILTKIKNVFRKIQKQKKSFYESMHERLTQMHLIQ